MKFDTWLSFEMIILPIAYFQSSLAKVIRFFLFCSTFPKLISNCVRASFHVSHRPLIALQRCVFLSRSRLFLIRLLGKTFASAEVFLLLLNLTSYVMLLTFYIWMYSMVGRRNVSFVDLFIIFVLCLLF